ncbi:rhomboid family intramembrane serine protease [Aquibacillus kalidii]|uniref:rhomboid family intramembrane serine protease n=1 Tax=Aquibacillus kalidii TaxID=2762597 RepID=UPI001645348E|nr:rhomboid family intramembrane serine protease [Aquibacillus kalidii]
MYLNENYFYNRLAYQLIHDHHFEIIYINSMQTEMVLEKKIKGSSHVVRLMHRQFDWRNHLQLDVDQTVMKLSKLKQFILGNGVHVHNIYIAEKPPVDEWESIKKTIELKNRKFTKLSTYYADELDRKAEINRFFDYIGLDFKPIDYPDNELEMERLTHYLKTMVAGEFQKKQNETESLFRNGKPRLTYFILIANIILFVWMELNGGTNSATTLIQYGAKYNPAILDGEWWRIITSMFIHIGLLHLVMNMFALYYVGSAVEQIYGNIRFFVIYFLAGILGSLTSFALNPQLAAGASGAIFGLFGALLFFGLIHRRVFFQTMGKNIIFVIVFNIIFGFSIPEIDNGAHLGGLLGGFLGASIVNLPKKNKFLIQGIALLSYLCITTGFVIYGTSNSTVDETLFIQQSQELIQKQEYNQVIDLTTDAMEYADTYEAELLFNRAYAYIKENRVEAAQKDLESVVEMKPEFAEAHYNLSLIYNNQRKFEKALEHVEKALELQPNKRDWQELHQRLLEAVG